MTNYLQPDWPAPATVRAYTTLRPLFKAHEPLPAYNPEQRTSYVQLCESLMHDLALPTAPIWLEQIHSADVCEAIPQNQNKKADASFTHEPERICAVITADCLPILLCNRQGTQVAAIHAGWRGLAKGVIENTVKQLRDPAADLLAWLGPGIGPTQFEVGAEVYDAFTASHPHAKIAFKPHTADKWLANLYQLAKLRLETLGVTQIYGGKFCTYTQEELFYSYRRDKGKTGRMASLIWISR